MNPLLVRLLTSPNLSNLELDVRTNGSGGTQGVIDPAQSSSEQNCSRAEKTSLSNQTTEEISLAVLATDMRDAPNEELGSQALIGGFSRDMLDDCPLSLESVVCKDTTVLMNDEPEYDSDISLEINSDINDFVEKYLGDSNPNLMHQQGSTLLCF
jgi:hypothetical protein